ncbi:MAG: hypothetical protein L0387_45370 [Acidobacteria bacterium]|nr:hypothetical protein [Acidobacteriota bacterium]MCI0718826.1 hypothetical protein [Acidobacteriota bacterium]
MTYSIQVVQVGRQEVLGACIYYMERFDVWEPFVFTMVVVRGEGHTIVINSGLPKDLTVLDPYWPMWPGERKIEVSEAEQPQTVLRRIGVDVSEVDFLIISPLVYYATSNMDLFPNAQICLLKRGWIDFHSPAHRSFDNLRHLFIPDKILMQLVTNAWPRVRLLEDEDEVLAGIRTFFAGVHHRSSMAVSIETAKGTVIFSDSFFKFRNVEENIPVGYVENLEEAYLTYARIRKEAKLLIPAFDPELFERYPAGIVA